MTQERILIVEDEANERTGLAELVSSWGYRTDTAADGVEALEKVSSFSPSIVITDIKMPRMDGMELVEKLADLSQSIAVVMVTAQKPPKPPFMPAASASRTTLRSRSISAGFARSLETSARFSRLGPRTKLYGAHSVTRVPSAAWSDLLPKCWKSSTSSRWLRPALPPSLLPEPVEPARS